MKTILNYKISGKADTFQVHKVQVDKQLNCLYLDLDYPQEINYMTFIMVKDEVGNLRLQKLLGYGEQKLAIGNTPMETTIGGVAGTINPGTWEVCVGLFTEYVSKKLGEREAVTTITISDKGTVSEPIGTWNWTKNNICQVSNDCYDWDKKFMTGASWYRGDFHTHTRLSDGKETVENNMQKASGMGMDFYVPTEHNLMHTGWIDDSKCILPGTEITTNYGHFNIFGIKNMPTQLMEVLKLQDQEPMEDAIDRLIEEMKEAGGIISINHPFLTEWKWLFEHTKLSDIDTMEIINDPTYTDAKEANKMAVDFIDEMWKDGHKIYGVGGSDAHNLDEDRYEGSDLPSVVCDPLTRVYCEDLTPNNLMDSVKKGHMCVTRFCNIIPHILINGKDVLPGEEVPKGSAGIYHIDIKECEKSPRVNLIQGGKRMPLKVEEVGNNTYRAVTAFAMGLKEWDWVRLEVLDECGEFLGYTNPIYSGEKESEYTTFNELKKYAESCGIIHD